MLIFKKYDTVQSLELLDATIPVHLILMAHVIRVVSLTKPGENVVKIHKIIDRDVDMIFSTSPVGSFGTRVAYEYFGVVYEPNRAIPR